MKTNIESVLKGRTFSLVMFTCVVGFVLFKRFYRDLGDVFIFLVVLGTIASVCYNFRLIKKDPIFIAFFLSLIVPVISWINSKVQIPELAKDSPSPFLFYDFFFFWFIAYWTNGKNERIAAILLAYCLSVLGIYITHSPDFIGEIVRGLRGSRIDFDVVNAQYTSLFAGFGFISAAFLFVIKLNLSLRLEVLKKLGAATLLAFFILIILITQSRQVWLALVACILFAPLAHKLISNSRVSTRATVLTYSAFALIIAAASSIDIVEQRITTEKSTIIKIVNLDLESVPDSGSIGLRIHLWLEAWEWIKKRPILGSGEDARELVITESEKLPKLVRDNFTHLHNSHLETLVSFGLLGAAIIYFLIVWPPVYTTMASPHSVQKTWKAFSLIVVIFWLTVNFFESYFYSADGIFIFSVFYGVVYSFKFPTPVAKGNQPRENPRKKYFCQT